MPRIRPRLLWQAARIHTDLPLLLPVCRDLPSALNELRWLDDHAKALSQTFNHAKRRLLLEDFVDRRSHGEPLQYIIGSEFFGDLEIQCRPGVLIPRHETATSVTYLVELLRSSRRLPERLRVLDLCTGTGCIPLLFHSGFYSENAAADVAVDIVGVDISSSALELARENLFRQIANQANKQSSETKRTRSLHGIRFVHGDVLEDTASSQISQSPPLLQALQQLQNHKAQPQYDILISNPPYISPKHFQRTTAKSVRNYEPKLALVPSRPIDEPDAVVGDFFYPRLLEVADQVRAKIILFEVADMDQAGRVVEKIIQRGGWDEIEIWRDEPEAVADALEVHSVYGRPVSVRGSGHGRFVFARRGESLEWFEQQCRVNMAC